jgi:DNA-binding NarL/FixJ family response regulator
MKILVVDDHPLIVGALAHVLGQLDPAIEVRGALDPAEAVAVLDNEPDVALVLLDLALPGMRGLDFLCDLKLDYPGVPIVVLSATHDAATVAAALGAGAHGFIPKTADASKLLDAVRRVLEGGICRIPDAPAMPEGDGVRIRPDALGLTARQTDVLRLLAQGKPNKLICRDLTLSEGTVKVHVSAILKALNVHSRTEAIAVLARRGISAETLSVTARRSPPGPPSG